MSVARNGGLPMLEKQIPSRTHSQVVNGDGAMTGVGTPMPKSTDGEPGENVELF